MKLKASSLLIIILERGTVPEVGEAVAITSTYDTAKNQCFTKALVLTKLN